jgi:uncharacterized membrane protein YdbT with pleckstrin-like domain
MKDEKVICRADIRYTPKKIIFVIWYVVAVMVVHFGSYKYTSGSREYWAFFDLWTEDDMYRLVVELILAVIFFLPVIVWGCFKYTSDNCSLCLTENGINGNRKKLFSNKQLNLPIDKVDNIMVSESIFDKMHGGRTVAVRSTSGLIKFPWVQNSEEFVNKTLAKIEEFKQKVKEDNQSLVSAVVQNAANTNNSNNSSAATKIKELKELLDSGIISQEEFDTKKKELLDKM